MIAGNLSVDLLSVEGMLWSGEKIIWEIELMRSGLEIYGSDCYLNKLQLKLKWIKQ